MEKETHRKWNGGAYGRSFVWDSVGKSSVSGTKEEKEEKAAVLFLCLSGLADFSPQHLTPESSLIKLNIRDLVKNNIYVDI